MRASGVTAGSLLSSARARAELTQRELARRSGVTQSVIAAYELGTREPALSTLSALVEATGITLEVELGASLPATQTLAHGPIGRKVRRRRAAILALAQRHGVTDIRLFGSVARSEEHADSDLDLLVHLPDGAGLFTLARFKTDLEQLLHLRVDVVPDDGVKPRVMHNIEPDLIAL